MADSCREILAKRRQSRSMTATADDTESAADAPMPIGKERHSSPVASARRRRPWTTHLPVSIASSRVAAATSQCCLQAAGCSATARRPVQTSPQQSRDKRSHPSVDSYAHVKVWTFFDVQGGGQLICEFTCAQIYTVREFSRKIGLATCEENCVVH